MDTFVNFSKYYSWNFNIWASILYWFNKRWDVNKRWDKMFDLIWYWAKWSKFLRAKVRLRDLAIWRLDLISVLPITVDCYVPFTYLYRFTALGACQELSYFSLSINILVILMHRASYTRIIIFPRCELCTEPHSGCIIASFSLRQCIMHNKNINA